LFTMWLTPYSVLLAMDYGGSIMHAKERWQTDHRSSGTTRLLYPLRGKTGVLTQTHNEP
jgi:hypothetical protein